jgi:hypothetical protein
MNFFKEAVIKNIVIYSETEQLQWFEHVGRTDRTRILITAWNKM